MKNMLTAFLTLCLITAASGPASAQVPSRIVGQGSGANVLIDLSARLINAAVAGDQDEISDVNEVILGTPVTGKARTLAHTSAELVPNENNAVVDVYARGQTLAKTIGTPTTQQLLIYADSTTPFIARKRLYLNEDGLNSYPAEARASTTITVDKITDYQGRTDTFSTSIGELFYQAKKPLYEHYTTQKTETKLTDKLESSVKPLIAKGNSDIAKYLQQIKSAGVPLQEYHLSTTATAISLGAPIALPGHNTPVDPPLPAAWPFDVAARAHQNALNDSFQAVLGGKTFTAAELGSITSNSAASLQAHPGRQFLGTISDQSLFQAMSITFADAEPIVVVFADHGLTLTAKVKEFRVATPRGAGLRLPGLTVRAVYKFANAPGKVELVRQGPVQIAPFYNHPIGGRILGAVLQTRLNQTFKERIAVPNLPIPSDLSKVGTLAANGGDADRGWIVLTWLQQPPQGSHPR